MKKTSIKDKIKSVSRGSLWRKTRNEHIEKEPYCQCCGRVKNLEVHHIIPWHIDDSLRVESSNLITLCSPCHFRFGHYSHWKDFNPNIRKDSIDMDVAEETLSRRTWTSWTK